MWVSPFRHLRITGYLLLPEAYRSLSRLSSAPSAKAFALRPCSLDLSNVLSEHLVSSWFSLLPTKIIVTLPFEIAIFLKRTYYNLCFAVIIQFSRYVFECPFQGPQNRTISTLLVPVTCSRWPTIFDVLPSAWLLRKEVIQLYYINRYIITE